MSRQNPKPKGPPQNNGQPDICPAEHPSGRQCWKRNPHYGKHFAVVPNVDPNYRRYARVVYW